MAKYTDKEMDRIISAGKKSYASMSNKGQRGGIASIPSSGKKDAFVQLQRQKFFDNRPDVSEDRILRRTRQEGALNQFKDALIRNDRVLKGTRFDDSTYTVMNPNTGEPVYLTDVPGGRSVGDVAQDLAYRFGPTPGEIFGDIGYGLGSIAKGFAEKGTPLMQLGKAGIEGLKKFFAPKPTEIKPSFDLEAKMSAYEDPIKFYASSSKQKYPGYTDQQSEYYYGDKPKESPKGDQYLYADVSKRDIQTLQPIKDMGLGYDSSINMFSPVIKDLKKKNPSLTDEEIKGIIEGTITEPTGQFAEATKTIMDPYSLIRGTQETLSNLGKTRYGTFGIDNLLNVIRGGAPTLTYEKELGPGVLSGKIGDNKASLGYSMIFNKGGRVRGTGIMGALR